MGEAEYCLESRYGGDARWAWHPGLILSPPVYRGESGRAKVASLLAENIRTAPPQWEFRVMKREVSAWEEVDPIELLKELDSDTST